MLSNANCIFSSLRWRVKFLSVTPSGTKEIIFDTAVGLILDIGYEKMNMRGIAARAGIKPASIYYYFPGKQEILDSIYTYYEEHFYENQKSAEEQKRIIAAGTREEIVRTLLSGSEISDEKKYRRMLSIARIIYFRISTDKRACDIFLNFMTKSGEQRVNSLLTYGISIGRMEAFDTKAYCSLLLGARYILAIKAFANPEHSSAQLEEEKNVHMMLAGLLPIK